MRLNDLDATALSRAIHDREASCREVLPISLAHIEAIHAPGRRSAGSSGGASAPAAFGAEGLPIGLQLIDPPQADLAVLRVLHAYKFAAPAVIDVRPQVPWH